MNGFAGEDRLVGSVGCDFMTGGEGNDIFDVHSPADSSLALADVVTDFVRGSDTIAFSTIDARTDVAGNQAFKLVDKRISLMLPARVHFSLIDNAGTGSDQTGVEFGRNGDGTADSAMTY